MEAAHADHTNNQTTIVIAQTSNEHLDELNARAQAIRRQHGELGDEQLEIPGRPYGLHAGDLVQVRHTIQRAEHGQLRNGTTATITAVDLDARELDLRLADGTQLQLREREIADADLRLAYVQHPFPAQGHTTDTAHLIIAAHATREGSYVALTRAREQTDIYAAETADPSSDGDRLRELADRISRTEPEVPSIQTPLSHEEKIRTKSELSRSDTSLHRPEPDIGEQAVEQAREEVSHEADVRPPGEAFSLAQDPPEEPNPLTEEPDLENALAAEPDPKPSQGRNGNFDKTTVRVWPRRSAEQQLNHEHLTDRDRTLGWEP